MKTTTKGATMEAKQIEFSNLRPGMKLAIQTFDERGVIAGREIQSIRFDDEGCQVIFTDRTWIFEDAERLSYNSTIAIAI